MNFSDFITTIDDLIQCLLAETALLKANRFAAVNEMSLKREELSQRYLEYVELLKASAAYRDSISAEARNLLHEKIESLLLVTNENQLWHARMSNVQSLIANALADSITAEENQRAKRYSPLGLYTQSRAVRPNAIAINSIY